MKKTVYLAFALLFCLFCKTNASFAQSAEMTKPELQPIADSSCTMERYIVPPGMFYGYNPDVGNVVTAVNADKKLFSSFEEVKDFLTNFRQDLMYGKGNFFPVEENGEKYILSIERTREETFIFNIESENLLLSELKVPFYFVLIPKTNKPS